MSTRMKVGALNPASKWTQEQRDRVAALLADGLSASEIGKNMGATRCAVIGLVGRDPQLREIGFARKPCSRSTPKTGRRISGDQIDRIRRMVAGDLSIAPKRTRGGVRGGKVSLNRIKVVDTPAVVPAPIQSFGSPQTVGIPLVMLSPRRCKWCINDPEPGANGHLFCGETTKIGKPYCSWHATAAVGEGTRSEQKAIATLR